jgi:hypothetical protein
MFGVLGRYCVIWQSSMPHGIVLMVDPPCATLQISAVFVGSDKGIYNDVDLDFEFKPGVGVNHRGC